MTGGRDSNSIPDGLARERRERFSPPLFLFAWWHLFLILLSPANSIYLGQSSPYIIVGFGKGAADPPNLLITPGPPCSLTQQNRAQKELFLFTAQLGKLFHPASPPGIPGAWRLQFCPGAAVPRLPRPAPKHGGAEIYPPRPPPIPCFPAASCAGTEQEQGTSQLCAVHGVFVCVPSTKIDTCESH